MKELWEIKLDMENDIKYYYSLDENVKKELLCDPVLQNGLLKRVNLYDELVKLAPFPLRNVYDLLYKQSKTQKQAATELGVSVSTVSKYNKMLLEYFFEKINKSEGM